MASAAGTQPVNIWENLDPFSQANKRAQARVDTGTSAIQQALNTRIQGFTEAKDKMLADAEWATRMGSQANFRTLSAQGGVHSGLRDRYAQRLFNQINRPLMFNLGNLSAAEQLARGDAATNIANLQANLPVMQAEELSRQYGLDAQALTNALTEAKMTGRWLPPQAKALVQGVIAKKQEWEAAKAAGDDAKAAAVHEEAKQMRAALQRMGIDPSLIGQDVTLGQASKNYTDVGTLTPEQRTLLEQMYGVDPVTGQQTLYGKSQNQALDMGALEYQIATNPEYGLAAQAKKGMLLTDAQIANYLKNAKGDGTDEDDVTEDDLMQRWGLTKAELGMTSNAGAFNAALAQINEMLMDGSTSVEELDALIQKNLPAYRQNGIDPAALAAAARKLVRVDAAMNRPEMINPLPFQAQRMGERANAGMPPQPGPTVPEGTTLTKDQENRLAALRSQRQDLVNNLRAMARNRGMSPEQTDQLIANDPMIQNVDMLISMLVGNKPKK